MAQKEQQVLVEAGRLQTPHTAHSNGAVVPHVLPFTPAQTKRVQELARRLNVAQTALNEFAAYLAEEHGVAGDDAANWRLDVEHGAWTRAAPKGE